MKYIAEQLEFKFEYMAKPVTKEDILKLIDDLVIAAHEADSIYHKVIDAEPNGESFLEFHLKILKQWVAEN
jgi:hypothetical protein